MQIKTSLDALLERTAATGYVVLDSMATVLLESAYAESATPSIETLMATMPAAEDYWFWKRCQLDAAIHQRVGR
jgi:hypothetical protein